MSIPGYIDRREDGTAATTESAPSRSEVVCTIIARCIGPHLCPSSRSLLYFALRMRHPHSLPEFVRLIERTCLLMLSGILILVTPGCVERELVVESNPDGALVYMNDQEIGRTPIRRDFQWYGTYDVVVRKDGYETLRTRTPVIAPPWLWMPFDLICQILPFRITDTQRVKYELKPASEAATDPARMIRRGRELQGKLESGEATVFKPLTTQPATQKAKSGGAARPAMGPGSK